MSRLVRTRQRPYDDPIVVEDGEYFQMLAMGMVLGEAPPAPQDPDDVAVSTFLENETGPTYAALMAVSGTFTGDRVYTGVADFTDATVLGLPAGSGGGGVTDHGALTGLGDDDHLQYLTTGRGDVRYYTKGQTDTALAGKEAAGAAAAAQAFAVQRANHSGTQTAATISDLTEAVQDIVGALIVAGTNTTVSYNDAAGTFTINATAAGGGTTDPEVVRDTIGGALVAGAGVTITVNDAGDTITIASTAVLPTRQITAGTGLSGGGDLSVDRALSVAYGTTAGTAVQGNDTRVTADQAAATASIRTLGTGAQQAAAGDHSHVGGATSSARPLELWVISVDAPADLRTAAVGDPYMFLCDGSEDAVQINQAIDSAAPLLSRNAQSVSGADQLGRIHLSGGRFTITNTPVLMRTGVHLMGQGILSELFASGTPATTSSGVGSPMGLIKSATSYDHAFTISDLLIEGNYSGGGSAHGIYLDSDSAVVSASTATATYPDTSPDAYVTVRNVHVLHPDHSTAIRHGIWINGVGGSSNLRGSNVFDCIVRVTSGHGVYVSAASDCTISGNHLGGIGQSGFRIATGNARLIGNKAYYCDDAALHVSSGRCTISGFESQDSNIGANLAGGYVAAAGMLLDTSLADGLIVAADYTAVTGLNVFLRSGGRYATQTNGVRFTSGFTHCNVMGVMDGTGITTDVSGALGAGSFARIPGFYSIG